MEVDLKISFNINDYVRFKITEEGIETYAQYQADNNLHCYGPSKYREAISKEANENNGYVTMQMWQVMHIFGPKLSNGGPQQIAGNRIYLTKYNAVLEIDEN